MSCGEFASDFRDSQGYTAFCTVQLNKKVILDRRLAWFNQELHTSQGMRPISILGRVRDPSMRFPSPRLGSRQILRDIPRPHPDDFRLQGPARTTTAWLDMARLIGTSLPPVPEKADIDPRIGHTRPADRASLYAPTTMRPFPEPVS